MNDDTVIGEITGCACGLDDPVTNISACQGGCYDESFYAAFRFCDLNDETKALLRAGIAAEKLAEAIMLEDDYPNCDRDNPCFEACLEGHMDDVREAKKLGLAAYQAAIGGNE